REREPRPATGRSQNRLPQPASKTVLLAARRGYRTQANLLRTLVVTSGRLATAGFARSAADGQGRSKIMKILVLGGDGYLGWPTALHFSEVGHDVAVVDNFARRGYDFEMGVDSLVPLETLQTRIRVWRDL